MAITSPSASAVATTFTTIPKTITIRYVFRDPIVREKVRHNIQKRYISIHFKKLNAFMRIQDYFMHVASY